MSEANRLLGTYLHLARASQARMQPMVRDKLLVLAGVQAEAMGLATISALCRQKVLAHNARHMLRDWPTLEVALADERFRSYLKQLHRRYSPEKTEHMLDSLGIELARERELYDSDLEYAAALLDIDPAAIDATLSDTGGDRALGPAASDRRTVWSAAQIVPLSRMRRMLVVWGPFWLGLVLLAIWAVALRALAP